MAGVSRSARQPGKSDAIDTLAVARAAWREPDLPVAQLDGPSREVRLLVDHRDDLAGERTRLRSASDGICTRLLQSYTSRPAVSSSNTSSSVSMAAWHRLTGWSPRSRVIARPP